MCGITVALLHMFGFLCVYSMSLHRSNLQLQAEDNSSINILSLTQLSLID
jgi:hypothetical protein